MSDGTTGRTAGEFSLSPFTPTPGKRTPNCTRRRTLDAPPQRVCASPPVEKASKPRKHRIRKDHAATPGDLNTHTGDYLRDLFWVSSCSQTVSAYSRRRTMVFERLFLEVTEAFSRRS